MKNTIKLISMAIIVICISAFTIGKTTLSEGYKIGDVAEDFSLKNVDGKMVSLSDYKNAKGFIVTFTCNTCPFAVAYEDRIIALDKKYKNLGYYLPYSPSNYSPHYRIVRYDWHAIYQPPH